MRKLSLIFRLFIIFLTIIAIQSLLFRCNNIKSEILNIAYVKINDSLDSEDSTAYKWLDDNQKFRPNIINILECDLSQDFDVIWIHIPDSCRWSKWKGNLEALEKVKALYFDGNSFLFTDYAAMLPYEIGIESKKPELRTENIKDYWIFDKKGFQSFRGHPVFSKLFGGNYFWDSNSDHIIEKVGYFDENFPSNGKVIATEKSYITIDDKSRLVIEYNGENRKIISVGSLIYFERENNIDYKMKKFIENCLLYSGGILDSEDKSYWVKSENKPVEFTIATSPLKLSEARNLENLPSTSLVIEEQNPDNEFFDISGKRAVVMGYQNGGIDELWVHPFRVARDFKAGIVFENSIKWLDEYPLTMKVCPESVTRIYETDFGELKEMIYPSFNRSGAIIHYEGSFSEPVKIMIKMRYDLRWMWPYSESALGNIYYGYDEILNAVHIKDKSGDFYCVSGADIGALEKLLGQFSDIKYKSDELAGIPTNLNQVYHASLYELSPDNDYILNYAIVGTNEGEQVALEDYRYLLENPYRVYCNFVDHYVNLLENMVIIESPDKEFNNLWRWSLVGVDRFFVETPGLGSALVAGYSTTNRGWDGGHEISGRPGYGWYFGRDAAWSCFAVDGYGDFEIVKSQLEFFQKFQDQSGKIFHELSTSGVIHYDAADATPLYVILAGHYLKSSGDIEFISGSWENIQKAMEFLYSTDTDGDLLIENTNVGHGWVEGGKLWGAHSTFYLSGLWAQALEESAYMAFYLGEEDLSESYKEDYNRVKNILNTDFWNDSTMFYSYGKFKDGRFNPEKTILPAPIIHFGFLDDKKVKMMLQDYAGNGFSTDWGVRILSSESPLFDPSGYHYGSVWPLFTGWCALAEYRYGNSVQGFMHIMNNLYIKNYWDLGFVEEVMNGLNYEPAGVCPHQCWSETNIIHPTIEGMIGWKPDALKKSVQLSPRFPLNWDKVLVENLRVGNSKIAMKMNRSKNETNYFFKLQEGEPVRINFAPEIPDGMEIRDVILNGEVIKANFNRFRGILSNPISFMIEDSVEIKFKHTGGIGCIPVVPRPEPGDLSKGYRIINARLDSSTYTIEFEGRSGSACLFELNIFDQKIKSIRGADFEAEYVGDIVKLKIPFRKSKREFVTESVVVEIEK